MMIRYFSLVFFNFICLVSSQYGETAYLSSDDDIPSLSDALNRRSMLSVDFEKKVKIEQINKFVVDPEIIIKPKLEFSKQDVKPNPSKDKRLDTVLKTKCAYYLVLVTFSSFF